MRVVGSMHERKALMAELSDAFVALPGGIGTLEELFEVYTWAQLGLHNKPCAILNVAGYFDGIAAFLAHAVEERFLRVEHLEVLMVETEAARAASSACASTSRTRCSRSGSTARRRREAL